MAEGTKERRTFYAEDRVEAARRNAERHDWAAELRDEAVSTAESVLETDLPALWESIPGQRIPRSGYAGDGNRRETWEPIEGRPWKVTDGEYVLPTNDFAAYRESGRDDRGFFDPERADDDLLVNEEHPEMGEGWGVDDGYGWEDADGDVGDPGDALVPVAFYNHWYLWYDLRDDLVALRDAYLFTGDVRYARAGLVALDRIADEYPRMDIHPYEHDRFWNSHGGTGEGKIVGSIWETNLVRNFANAYDAFFPAADDEALVDFLAARAAEYPGLGVKDSPGAIRGNVEEGIVREVLPAVERAQIRGNLGMHHSALATAAVVQDEPDGYTGEALDFLYRAGELRTVDDVDFRTAEAADDTDEQRWELTGGDLSPALVERIDRDGYADEGAPNYDVIVRNQLARVADVLDRYEPGSEATSVEGDGRRYDLYEHPKMQRAVGSHYPMVQLDRYMPSIGDSGLTGNPETKLDAADAVRAFEVYGDPVFARIAHALNGSTVEGLHGDVFSPNADAVAGRIEEIVDREGSYDPGSVLEPSHGFAALRDGSREGGNRRSVTSYFGRNSYQTGTSHCHANVLDLGIYAHGLALAPDLGYPEYTGDWPKHDFTKGTISHNTVVVNAADQDPVRVGEPTLFRDAEAVSLLEVNAPEAYAATDEYRRTTAQVRIDEDDSYVADVFRVDGGDDHLFGFHGAEGDVTTEGLSPEPREGTYAGPDVPFPDHGEATEYHAEVGNGFDYLRDVVVDESPPAAFGVDWDVVDTWDVLEDERDVHLRLTMLGTDALDHVALADGEPPRKDGNPESLRYLLARRTGTDLDTAFRSVIEPYVDDSRIVAVDEPEVAGNGAAAIRVELDTGRTDWIVSASQPDAEFSVDGRFSARGSFAFYAERDGDPVRAHLAGGTRLHSETADATLIERDSAARLDGRVEEFTRDLSWENRIVVTPDGAVDVVDAAGDYLHVETDGGDNGVYEIRGIEQDGDRAVVDVGGATTVEDFAGSDGEEYEFVVEEGARARIPAYETWSPEP